MNVMILLGLAGGGTLVALVGTRAALALDAPITPSAPCSRSP